MLHCHCHVPPTHWLLYDGIDPAALHRRTSALLGAQGYGPYLKVYRKPKPAVTLKRGPGRPRKRPREPSDVYIDVPRVPHVIEDDASMSSAEEEADSQGSDESYAPSVDSHAEYAYHEVHNALLLLLLCCAGWLPGWLPGWATSNKQTLINQHHRPPTTSPHSQPLLGSRHQVHVPSWEFEEDVVLPEDYVGKRKKRRRRFGRKRPSKRAQKAKAVAAAAAAASVASVDRCMSLTRSPERSPRMRTRLARARQGSDVSDDLSVESTQEWPSQVPVRPPSPRFRVPSRGGSLIWNGSGAAVARHQLFQMRSMFPYMDDDVVRFGPPVPCRLVVLLQ